MAYSERIKDYDRIRAYLRAFYVYGFRYRGEIGEKSRRSYDNERRRVESWLGDCMRFRQDEAGRRVFLSVDSRAVPANPLYRAFRAKSFTDRDITLHFHLLDILQPGEEQSIARIMDELELRLVEFDDDQYPDESTVRKKLGEYVKLGLVRRSKRGRETVYRRAADGVELEGWAEAAAFFSEAAPLGVIGSYLLDRMEQRPGFFRFKHHYILHALDSEVLCTLLSAIGERLRVRFSLAGSTVVALPQKLYIGTQSGRQYLLAWVPGGGRFAFFRVDQMDRLAVLDRDESFEALAPALETFCAHTWGVTGSGRRELTHLEMTVHVGEEEEHIPRRLAREKRCGRVERVDESHWRFTADVYDALELLPWLRTFLGRVTELKCDNKEVLRRFWWDFDVLETMYGGEDPAVP